MKVMNDNIISIKNDMINYNKNNGPRKGKVLKIFKRISEIEELLNKKLSLVFVTDKGMGKTSIINYILDLLYEKEKKIKNGRKISVFQDVLETGSGATTTSETEIVQSKEEYSEIEIIPLSESEVLDLLKNFAKYIFQEVYQYGEEHVLIAPELFRAIRNMTGLKEVLIEGEEKIDQAKKLAEKYTEDQYDRFEEEIIMLANLNNRTTTRFIIESTNEKENIRSVFNKINLLNYNDIPLPQKVIIKLSKDVFDFDVLGNVKSIIDTRGLESGVIATDRRDIRDLFKRDKDKIIILVDKFNSPSQSIMKLLDTYMQEDDYETINRVAYLVNFKDGEPENVVSNSGKVNSEIDGIEVKRRDLCKYIKNNKINIKDENILFTNPKRYLDPNGKIVIDEYDIEDYGDILAAREIKKEIRFEKKKDLCDDIKKIVNNYTRSIMDELNYKIDEFKSIRNKDIEELNLDINMIRNFIENFELEINYLDNKQFELFNEYISSCHHSTLMALNNRFGIYYDRDIFLVGSTKVESLFKRSLANMANEVINILVSQVNSKEKEKVIAFIINDIKKYYYKFVDEINTYVYDHLKNDIFASNKIEFWKGVIDRWGKGNGYINDIENSYKKHLEEEKIDLYINSEVSKWVSTFKNGMISVINENS